MKTNRMTLGLLAIVAAVALIAGTAAAKQPWDKIKIPPLNTFEMPAYERVVLDNGMVLYLAEDHFLPMVTLSAQIMVGSIYEPADKVGMAQMTGSVMRTGGAGERTGDQIDALVEARGMQLETWIGGDTGGAFLSCLTEDVGQGLELLADILRRPRFAPEKLDLAKQEQKASIARRNDEPLQIAMREAPKVLFGADHPLARHPEYDTIDAVTREDLLAFHARFFHPDRAFLVVSGDFETRAMVERIAGVFAGWSPAPAPLPPDPAIPQLPSSVNIAAKSGLTQATVLLGHLGIRNDHEDYAAIRVAAEILGGGFASRLFREIRSNRGLAYSVGATPGTGWRFPGAFLAFTMTKNETVEAAAQGILDEIKRMLAEPVSREELELARDSILNSEIFDYDSKRKILDRLVLFEMYGYEPDFLQRYQQAVRNLTPADIQAACRRVWQPENLIFLVVGTPDQFDGDFSRFGQVREIDIAIPAPTPKLEIPAATPESLARGKELMRKLRDKCGGRAFAALKSWYEESEVTVQTPMGAMAMTMAQTVKLPDHFHIVTKMPFGEMTQILAGDQGWTAGMQAKELSADEIKEMRDRMQEETLSILRRVDDLEFQALAPMEIAGAPCHPVVVRFGDKATIMFLDAQTDLLVMVQSPGNNPMTGSPVTQKTYIESHQQKDGFTLPHRMTIKHDDEDFATVEVKQFKANPTVDPALFKR
ncbi:MAG: pitrilysin family protein [Candidatus Krumholzibacteria bacterium]|jgi:predicted Zn-dependent peptidase|nr:pitrilysin family protein [Candidatus Krumholzibacteria bacterium]